jgi:hypothetical protein
MADDTNPPGLPSRRFEGRDDFRQLLRDAFACAAREGWLQIIVSDAHFDEWPLGERAVAESLQAWSKTGRHFTILAKNYDDVVRRHPRFVAWRRVWSHIIEARACAAADPLELPSLVWSPAWVLERRDLMRSAGFCGSEPDRRIAARERVQEWLARSAPAFPATQLGL